MVSTSESAEPSPFANSALYRARASAAADSHKVALGEPAFAASSPLPAATDPNNSLFRKLMGGMSPSSQSPGSSTSSDTSTGGGASPPHTSAAAGTSHARLDAHAGGRSSSHGLAGSADEDTLPFNVEAGEAGEGGKHPGFFSSTSYKNRPPRPPSQPWSSVIPDWMNPRKMTRRQMVLALMFAAVLFIAFIIIVASAAKNPRPEGMGPAGDEGSAETGKYKNLFVDVLGKSPAEVETKLAGVWDHFFLGDIDAEAVYVEVEPDMAQIINTESNVVTSEGISYGMIVCVHLEKKEAFNRLWNWARFHMQHTAGEYEAFFAWRVTRGGLLIDAKDVIPAPDAEAYIATALIAAHRKWGSTNRYPYKAEAMRLIEAMGNWQKGFFTKDAKATFNPTDWGLKHSNPSYHLPHFYEAYSRFLRNEGDPRAATFWAKAAKQSRKFFHQAAHHKTGLMPDYTTLDGKKAPDPNLAGHQNFQWDAWRAPANVAVDWAWWNADGWQQKYADRILHFFLSKGPQYDSQFTMEGKVAPNSTGHDPGLVSMNGVVALAARNRKKALPFVGELWDQDYPGGKGRYYPAMLYMMGLLHCSGKFKAYY